MTRKMTWTNDLENDLAKRPEIATGEIPDLRNDLGL